MECNVVKRKLSAFLDDELGRTQMAEIQRHLDGCPYCTNEAQMLSRVWSIVGRMESIEPRPEFWDEIAVRIEATRPRNTIRTLLFRYFTKPGFSLAATVCLVIGLVLGAYLGTVLYGKAQQPKAISDSASGENPDLASLHLSVLGDFPAESVGGAYLSLASEEE